MGPMGITGINNGYPDRSPQAYCFGQTYRFILLNLAFSLQAAYAAPLILPAQTRQADREKVQADADAQHREALAMASDQRLALAEQHARQLVELLEQNTQLTEFTRQLSQRIEVLTLEMHDKILRADAKA